MARHPSILHKSVMYCAVSALLVTQTGCATNGLGSLVLPEVKGATMRPSAAAPQDNRAPDLQGALAYSEGYIDAYQQAEQYRGGVNVVSGVLLIPLGVFAGVKSITGANSKQIASLAGGALGGYSLSSFLGSKSYSTAYNYGRTALTCANQAVSSASLSDQQYTALVTASTDLPGQLSNLAYLQTTDTDTSAEEAAKKAKALALLQTGPDELSKVTDTLNFVRLAGPRLVAITDNVAAKVDLQIDTANIGFAQYRSTVAGLLPTAEEKKFEIPPVPPTTAKPGGQTTQTLMGLRVGGGASSPQPEPPQPTLDSAITEVQASYYAVDPIIKSVNISAVQTSLTACLNQ
jgi:hypothetical protein